MEDMPTYNVYTLTDGCLGEEIATDDLEHAWSLFAAMESNERDAQTTASNYGEHYAETTVHLYDTWEQRLIAETCITAA